MPTLDEKRAAMGAKVASDAAKDLVVPRLPASELPAKIAKSFPDLTKWNHSSMDQMEQWRQQLNTVVNRSQSEQNDAISKIAEDANGQSTGLQAQITAMQTQIADLQAKDLDLQQQIDDLTP